MLHVQNFGSVKVSRITKFITEKKLTKVNPDREATTQDTISSPPSKSNTGAKTDSSHKSKITSNREALDNQEPGPKSTAMHNVGVETSASRKVSSKRKTNPSPPPKKSLSSVSMPLNTEVEVQYSYFAYTLCL